MGEADALTGTGAGRDDRERLTLDGAEPENFIPWSQIEPLLRDGMSVPDLKAALCRATGLDPERHIFVTRQYTGDPREKSMMDALRDGLYVERRDVLSAGGPVTYLDANDRVISPGRAS